MIVTVIISFEIDSTIPAKSISENFPYSFPPPPSFLYPLVCKNNQSVNIQNSTAALEITYVNPERYISPMHNVLLVG